MSFIALLRRRTIGSGVPFGKKKGFQPRASTPGRSCSPVVGPSAMIGTRFCDITAMSFTVRVSLRRPGVNRVAYVVDYRTS